MTIEKVPDFDKFVGKTITEGEGTGQIPSPFFAALMRGVHKNGAPEIFLDLRGTEKHTLDAHAMAVVGPDQIGELVNRVGEKGVQAIKKALNDLDG